MKHFVGDEIEFKLDVLCEREPVKVLEGSCGHGSRSERAGKQQISTVDILVSIELLSIRSYTIKNEVVQSACNDGMSEDFNRSRRERVGVQAEIIYDFIRQENSLDNGSKRWLNYSVDGGD